jgi:predicted Zn-dependent protease
MDELLWFRLLPRLALCCFAVLLFSVSVADDLTADQVLEIKSPFIQLSDAGGVVVDKIRRSWVLHLVTVSQRMVQAYRLLLPTLVIVKQSEPNALVEIRHGQILLVVNTDMLRLLGDDEDLMAAVISHEVGHLRMGHWRHGHPLKSIFSVARLKAGSASDDHVVGSGRDAKSLSTKFAADGSKFSSIGFSQKQEHEVDSLSIRAMVTAGYDPAAMVRFWRLMQAGDESTGSWLAEHPLNAERLHTMQSVATSLAEIYAANKAARVPTGREVMVFGARVSKMPAETVGLEGVNGVMVSAVAPQSAAAAAGIAAGDILLRVDGTPIDNLDDVQLAVADAARGSIVEIKLLRRAVPVWVRVQL